jgi:tetratricopeptide (TPR) repeat protein
LALFYSSRGLAKYHLAIHEYDKALEYLEHIEEYAKEASDYECGSDACCTMANVYLHSRSYDLGLEMIEKSFTLAKLADIDASRLSFVKGRLLLLKGKKKEAIKELLVSIKSGDPLSGRYVQRIFQVGKIMMNFGEPDGSAYVVKAKTMFMALQPNNEIWNDTSARWKTGIVLEEDSKAATEDAKGSWKLSGGSNEGRGKHRIRDWLKNKWQSHRNKRGGKQPTI